MKRSILATLLVLAAVACTPKEEAKFSDSRLVNDGSVVYFPTAKIQPFVLEGDTKTTLSIDPNEGAKFQFVAGDRLGVYPYSPKDGDQVSFGVKAITESTCTFEGSGFGLLSGELYAVYYPFMFQGYGDEANGITSASMKYALPVDYTTQCQTSTDGTTFDISAVDYMVDNGIEPQDGTCEFDLVHLGALVVMDVTFTEAGNFTELSLSGNFVKTGTIDITTDPVVIDADEVGAATLALGSGSGLDIAAGETVRFCMLVSPTDLRNTTQTLTLVDDTDAEHSVEIAGKNYKAGQAYLIECALDAPVPAEPTNLSEVETANTYIVDVDNINPAGYYFDCTVAGNGQPVNLGALNAAYQYPASGTSALPAGGGVRVLLNQNSCVSEVAFADGKISFKATGTKGNAKIQLRDTNDDGAWVWLIWCTDMPGEVTFEGHTNDGGASNWGYGYKVLDRNIGALTNDVDESNPENMYGMYYQFGNPHPYTSSQMINNCDSGGWRIQDALAFNDKPYIGPDAYWFNPYSSGSNALLGVFWGGGSANDGSLKRGPAVVKTLYDPCPVGYKVMPLDFQIVNSDSANLWGWYKNGKDGTVFFPYNGECMTVWGLRPAPYVPPTNPETGEGEQASYTSVWSASHNGRNMAFRFNMYSKAENRAGGGAMADRVLAYGCGVRCVADAE